jgi:ATP synthase protein I
MSNDAPRRGPDEPDERARRAGSPDRTDPTRPAAPPTPKDRAVPGLSPDQPPPSAPDAFRTPDPPPMHPALVPSGEHVAHSAIGSLLGGVLVWGGVGLLLDHWLQTGRILTASGIVVGFLTGFFIVYVRFGRGE